MGVGLDEWGNFTNLGNLCGLDGRIFTPNTVTVRGSAAANYAQLGTATIAQGIQANRANKRHVRVSVTPGGKLSVTLTLADGTVLQPISNLQLATPPATLKLGYAASTVAAPTSTRSARAAPTSRRMWGDGHRWRGGGGPLAGPDLDGDRHECRAEPG